MNPGENRRQRVNPVSGKKENHYRLVPRKSVQNPDDTSEAPRKVSLPSSLNLHDLSGLVSSLQFLRRDVVMFRVVQR